MITIAFDTASDRCTVAATDGRRVAHDYLDGARRHAASILAMISTVLERIGAPAADIGRVISADGPGSFTGLRVGATVAKAMVWQRNVEWLVAPSLLARAMGRAPSAGGVVLALSDALRGELYAGCWRISATSVEAIGRPAAAMPPEALGQFGTVDVVVGTIPVALVAKVLAVTGCDPVIGEPALPDARALLTLAAFPAVTRRVVDPRAWAPEYGRPAEAQAVWERTHGHALPDTPGIRR